MFLLAGFAQRNITPPLGINHYQWGARQHDVAQGIENDLQAGVLYLETSTEKSIIIDLDLHWLIEPELSIIQNRISSRFNIPGEKVRISYTHAHSIPAWGQYALDHHGPDAPGMAEVPAFTKFVLDQVILAVEEAINCKTKCHVTAGYGQSEIPVNRRLPHEGKIITGPNLDTEADQTITVVRFDDSSGSPYLCIVGVSAHPTVLGHTNSIISAEYPGRTKQVIKELTGAPCLFLQGCAGDQMTPDGFKDDLALHKKYGTLLAVEAAKVFLTLNPVPGDRKLSEVVHSNASLAIFEFTPKPDQEAKLISTSREIRLPVRDIGDLKVLSSKLASLENKLNALIDENSSSDEITSLKYEIRTINFDIHKLEITGGKDYLPCNIQITCIGDIALIGFPGEPFAQLGVEIREKSPFRVTQFAGYTNGWQGYLPTVDDYDKGGYEIEMASPFDREASRYLVQKILSILNELHEN